jgi:hypothetical protein
MESYVVLIWISFMPKAVDNFFMYLLAICISSENYLFICPLIVLFIFLMFSFLSTLYILHINPLSFE